MFPFSAPDKPGKRLAYAHTHAGSAPHASGPTSGLPKAGRFLIGTIALGLALAAFATHHPAEQSIRTQLYERVTGVQSSKAQLELGMAYRDGLYGVARNQHTAVLWFEKAAGSGNAYAAMLIGDMYAWGEGVPQNQATAMHWWRRAAQAGNAHATAEIGLSLMQHATTPFANDEAQQWLQRAAANGDAEALQAVRVDSAQAATDSGVDMRQGNSLFARLYDQWRRIVPGNQDIANLEQAAFKGDNVAQYQLALRYHDGSWGVMADPELALSWLRQAAQRGNPVAMDTLANGYREGSWGLTASPALADQWRVRAAHVRTYDTQQDLG
ncbi:MAG: tetratricopeptide repeat protein [Thiobacillaceae bacterium]